VILGSDPGQQHYGLAIMGLDGALYYPQGHG
jgi:hypothetical protein